MSVRHLEARPRPRWRLLLVASAALAFGEPRIPASDAEVLERLPAAALARTAEETPLAFARRAFTLGQRRWDPRLVGQAEAALASLPRHGEVRLLRAAILQNRHEFDAALVELEPLLAEPQSAGPAWLLRASIELVQGDPVASLASCARVVGRIDALAATTCAAQAAGRAGGAREARAVLANALGRATAPAPELEAWARVELGELAWRLGDPDAAERELVLALALEPESAAARALLADLYLDTHRPARARALFDAVPRAEALLLRLALAERALGEPAWRAHQRQLEASFAEARLRGGPAAHAREEGRVALELANDPARALELARANFAAQREPADARLLLEAARAAGEPGAASAALDWMARTRLEDARL